MSRSIAIAPFASFAFAALIAFAAFAACDEGTPRDVHAPPMSAASESSAPIATASVGITEPRVEDEIATRASDTSPLVNADAGAAIPALVPALRPGAYANLDPNDDYVVGPPDVRPNCEDELKQAGISFRRATLPVFTQKKSKLVCGSPDVVIYLQGPSGISYNAPPLLTCGMALALASFERVVQEEATRVFHSRVMHVDQVGTYVCREVAAYPGTVSEHSYANALDVMRFTLRNGKTVDILRDFDMSPDSPKKPEGDFLRAISRRANDEDIFSHVLTGFFNSAHKNHFHLDLARYRQDGTRELP